MSKWISVDFALPPGGKEVLVVSRYDWEMNGKEKVSFDIHIAERKIFQKGHIKWRCSKGSGYIQTPTSVQKVTHWMHLPAIPIKDE